MAQHAQLRIQKGLPVYFCDPHSPWQRGTNENSNGLLRQYFPKGIDLSRHSADDLAAVAATLNGRLRTGAPVAGQWQGQKRHELRGTSCGALNPCVTSTAPSIGGGPTNGVRREARLMLVAQRDGMRRPISVAAGSGSAT